MLSTLSGFVRRRQRGLAVVASVAGGAYLLAQYARQRFKDLSEKLVLDRAARENLRRRFQQNQEDCAFTLLALLPTLSAQILSELDVEAITAELQRRAEETKRTKQEQQHSSAGGDGAEGVHDSTASLPPPPSRLDHNHHPYAPEENVTDLAASIPLPDAEAKEAGPETNGANGHAVQGKDDEQEEPPSSSPTLPEACDSRSKAELWQETKILTFQRTMTSLYVLSLLALQTHIQLNLLGRHNYVSSIYEQCAAASSSSSSSASTSASASSLTLSQLEESDISPEELLGWRKEKDAENDRRHHRRGNIDPMDERQYLTFSWWFVQRGWRQVSLRVREACEEVLDTMPLKTQMGPQDLNKLLLEIRRKIEYEPNGAVHSFASALFPTTPEAEEETLRESGIASSEEDLSEEAPSPISSALRSLLDETQDFVDSPDFSIVLRSCLDRSFALLSSSLSHLFILVDNDDDHQHQQQTQQQTTSLTSAHPRFSVVVERKVRLAGILPALARSAHVILQGMPNEYAETLGENRELLEFSAVVYSNFVL